MINVCYFEFSYKLQLRQSFKCKLLIKGLKKSLEVHVDVQKGREARLSG